MRVITGSAKGRRLRSVKGMQTRPTSDRVKEAVFNILSGRIVDARVLDLFAGTGALAIEALSRGAASAVFVDNSIKAVDVIKDNLQLTGLTNQAEILNCSAAHALEILGRKNDRFDIVFVDPPYDRGLIGPVLEMISEKSILKANGLVIVECRTGKAGFQTTHSMLKLRRQATYGDTMISLLDEDGDEGAKEVYE